MNTARKLPTPEEIDQRVEACKVAPGPGSTITQKLPYIEAVAWLIDQGLASDWPRIVPEKVHAPIVQGNPTFKFITEQRAADRFKPSLIMTSMDDVEEEDVQWLWPGRIPLGAVSTVMGRMGNGKSTLRDWFTATVSGGHPWPDSAEPNEPGTVLVLQAEESKGRVVKHRLNAFGYGRGRVFTIDGVRRSAAGNSHFSMAQDAELLAEKCAQIGDVKLIVVDPIGAYLRGMKGNNDIEVRDCFQPIQDLAEDLDLAVITIGHPGKDGEKDVIDRLNGSAAFAQIVRSFWYLSEDPRDKSRKLLSLLKENIPGTVQTALAVHYDARKKVITWFPESVKLHGIEVDHMLQRAAREAKLRGKKEPDLKGTERAKAFLVKLLAAGDSSLSAAREKAMLVGIAFSTLRRAIAQLLDEKAIERYELGEEQRVWYRAATAPPNGPETDPQVGPV